MDKKEFRQNIKIGIPKTLNIWNTHQFWLDFFHFLGFKPENIIFSSNTSEEMFREFGRGRITVDCCFPVKCLPAHYGELVFKKKVNIIFSPMIHNLPSFLLGYVKDTFSCPRVMAGPEMAKAGFLKEKDYFKENGVTYLSPLVSLAEPELVCRQLYQDLKDIFLLDFQETKLAVKEGYQMLKLFEAKMRKKSREILMDCIKKNRPCIMALGRPYHQDPGIGHEIDSNFQLYGYPITWGHLFPLDDDILNWIFDKEIKEEKINHPLDISDVWPSSYSSNTNETIWAAKVATRFPWITAVLHFSSYECGMDQPLFTVTQKIIEVSGTFYFKFGELDSTKPTGSIKLRIETIAYYLEKYSAKIIERKLANLPPPPFELIH